MSEPATAVTAPELGIEPPVVEADAVFEGLLAFPRDARVEGTLRGEVRGAGQLEIGTGGRVEGTVEAEVVTVAGVLVGEVSARSALEVLGGGRVEAVVTTRRLRVADGGRVDGRVQMEPGGEAPGRSARA